MKGQSLVELALSLPALLLLGLGTVVVVRLADARSGLDAATAAAAAAAARQPDLASADRAADERFNALSHAYPLAASHLTVRLGGYNRGGTAEVVSSAQVDLSWAPFPGLPRMLTLQSQATVIIEPWRSRG